MRETNSDLLVVGRVIKPHGLNGEVAIAVLSDVPDRFAAGADVVVGGVVRRVTASRPHQRRMLVLFDGVTDRNAAESLRGQSIEAEPTHDGASERYFVHELVGVEVRATDGEVLGVVDGVIELPEAAGYDLLEVRRDDRSTWLLPVVDDYVEFGDEDGLTIWVVDPPEGLIQDSGPAAPPSAHSEDQL